MDLFEHHHARKIGDEQPLAARMRPRTLTEFFGQQHILAPGRLLWRAIQADQLSSLIFYGPPGTGKTTLAAVIANTTQSHFETLNAVLAGIPDIRRVTEEARRRILEHNRRTILFVDEVHRWNKAQQDALLPWVENGSVILIGATTENPYFTVNRALVSRSRIFQLQPLTEKDLEKVAQAALVDRDRGYGSRSVELSDKALKHIVNVANGDARAVLNAIELAVETTTVETDGTVRITMEVAEESIQRRAVLYDKEGDYHFDTISAFIKSMRGSDPDAAMYWLAKMVYAGEDPRFLFRRMLIFAAEDVGLADPQALPLTEAAAAAFDRVGMPEGQYHLGMTALYLATTVKSNSVFAYFDALATVEKEREAEVPSHLKDSSRDKHSFGHGQGYVYPHAYREHWVAQQYLPPAMQGKIFYQPGKLGYENELAATIARRREAQLAAAMTGDDDHSIAEALTWSPPDRPLEQWLHRAAGNTGRRLAEVREQLFTMAQCRRHHRVLCLADDTGLLTWEAVRQTPEGGVYVQTADETAARTLQARLTEAPELQAPHIVCSPLHNLHLELPASILFERIIGRSVISGLTDRVNTLKTMRRLLTPQGRLVLAEPIIKTAPRLATLVKFPPGKEKLADAFRQTEEDLYRQTDNPRVNWDQHNAPDWFTQAGFDRIKVKVTEFQDSRSFPPDRIESWFREKPDSDQPSLNRLLRRQLNEEDMKELCGLLKAALAGKSIPWTTRYLMIQAGN